MSIICSRQRPGDDLLLALPDADPVSGVCVPDRDDETGLAALSVVSHKRRLLNELHRDGGTLFGKPFVNLGFAFMDLRHALAEYLYFDLYHLTNFEACQS